MKYIVIISLALSIMTYQLNFTHFARGLSMIIIWCACIQGIHESSIELIRYGYPEKWCEKADKHRWLYGWGLRHQAKIIPGELMLCGFILSIWCFLSLLGLIVGWMMPDVFKGMDYIHTLGSVIIFFSLTSKHF